MREHDVGVKGAEARIALVAERTKRNMPSAPSTVAACAVVVDETELRLGAAEPAGTWPSASWAGRHREAEDQLLLGESLDGLLVILKNVMTSNELLI